MSSPTAEKPRPVPDGNAQVKDTTVSQQASATHTNEKPEVGAGD